MTDGGGEGLTEWTNVTQARASFFYPGPTIQPHYPADLGFFDLKITRDIA
jgi:hypothetical protein